MLLLGKKDPRQLKTASQEYLVAMQAFVSKRSRIESTLKERIQPLLVAPENLNTGITFLGDNIIAALQLGDLDHLSEEMEWVKVLLHAHERPAQELHAFMETYSNSIEEHINGQGAPIKNWLRAYASKGPK